MTVVHSDVPNRPKFTHPLTRVRVVLATCALLATAASAQATVHNVVLGAGYAAASSFTPTTAQSFAGAGSWYKLYPGPKAETYISPDVTFGVSITVGDIASVTYHTRNHANPSPVEYYTLLYTRGPGAGPYAHGFYEQRLQRIGHQRDSTPSRDRGTAAARTARLSLLRRYAMKSVPPRWPKPRSSTERTRRH